jgi:hypothetical protein
MDASATKTRIRRMLRLGVSDGANSAESGALGELEMELALLREENARLKVERHRAPDAGRVIERMRQIGEDANGASNGDGDDGASNGGAGALAECLAIRDALVEACHEVQQAMHGIRSRLGAMSPEAHSAMGERVIKPAPTETHGGEAELELALEAAAPPDLTQSAA